MRLGVVIDGSSAFISELLTDWNSRGEVEVFHAPRLRLPVMETRTNRALTRREMSRFLQEKDMVFFEWVGPLLALASRLPSRARLVTRLHSFELYAHAPTIRWESVNRVILVSHAMQHRFSELYPQVAPRSTVLYHGISMDKFHPAGRSFGGVIGMLCNLTPIKRVYEVILAVFEFNRSHGPLALRLGGAVGEDEDSKRYFAAMQRLVIELGLQNYVRFEGAITDPSSFLREIDIFISNSYWEGQQRALIEAMASGCYCLSHSWYGAEEVLPQENLYFTDGVLQDKLAAYCALSADAKRVEQYKLRAIAETRFDVQVRNAEMWAFLDGVLAGRSAKQSEVRPQFAS